MSFDIYLASRSPRRRDLLRAMGIQFKPIDVSVDEQPMPSEPALDQVRRLAAAKAQAGWRVVMTRKLPHKPVLGADTLVVLDQRVFAKPANKEDYYDTLRSLSGRCHHVMTGIAVTHSRRTESTISLSEVCFDTLSEDRIESYWRSGEPRDKAGGYGIQGKAASFVKSISGSYTGIVGLPLYELGQLLAEFDIDVL